MNSWVKFFAVATMLLGLTVAEEVNTTACFLESDLETKADDALWFDAIRKEISCLDLAFTAELGRALQSAKTTDEFRELAKQVCASMPQIPPCMAEVRERVSNCHNERLSTIAAIVTDLYERAFTSACENEGERLAIMIQGIEALKKDMEQARLVSPCFNRATSIFQLIGRTDIDFSSKSHLIYQTFLTLKKCTKIFQNEIFRTTADWLIDDTAAHGKCQDHDGNSLVLCSALDSSKVQVTSVCNLPPLNVTDLYDHLEKEMLVECLSRVVSQDLKENTDTADLQVLKDDLRYACIRLEPLGRCRSEAVGFAETCLSEEEVKQFHLLMDTVENTLEGVCVGDGEHMATIMHEVYRLAPEHGHAIRDCFRTVSEASKSDATSSKNMRFYHSVLAFKQCLKEKLRENSSLASDAEGIVDEVLKKMRCINPDDGTTVSCETIHHHHH